MVYIKIIPFPLSELKNAKQKILREILVINSSSSEYRNISIMAEAIVSDWLGEYNSLEPQEIRSFAALHAENHELSTAIQTILSDKSKLSDVSAN